MARGRLWVAGAATLALILVAALLFVVGSNSTAPRNAAATRAESESADSEAGDEQQEFEETTRARNEAAATADTSPNPEVVVPRSSASLPEQLSSIHYIKHKSWVGEHLFGNQVDWEPDVAADPGAPYVYVVTTRYGEKNAACHNCPVPALVYRVSDDNGDTWGPVKYLCNCNGAGWQADPQVEVASDGTVYGLIMQGWHELLVKSTDHGATFGPPVDVAPDMWADHGFLTISDDGQDVYVAFNHSDSYVVASHDGGVTWGDPVRTSPDSDMGVHYYFHFKGAVLAGGTVNIGATSLSTKRFVYAAGVVRYWDLRSTDGGATWKQIRLDTFKEQPDCVKDRCRHDHLGGQINVAADANGRLVAAYAGTRVAQQGQVIFTSMSSDEGATWSSSRRVSPTWRGNRRVIASFPQIVGTGDCDFRLWWQDDRNNIDSWNTWFTSSTDCGHDWGKQIRISDATNGAGYKHKAGYLADYGDYGGIAIMNDGRTIAAWGAGYSYWGAGGTWINQEP